MPPISLPPEKPEPTALVKTLTRSTSKVSVDVVSFQFVAMSARPTFTEPSIWSSFCPPQKNRPGSILTNRVFADSGRIQLGFNLALSLVRAVLMVGSTVSPTTAGFVMLSSFAPLKRAKIVWYPL